jgi:hypothetical protein
MIAGTLLAIFCMCGFRVVFEDYEYARVYARVSYEGASASCSPLVFAPLLLCACDTNLL